MLLSHIHFFPSTKNILFCLISCLILHTILLHFTQHFFVTHSTFKKLYKVAPYETMWVFLKDFFPFLLAQSLGKVTYTFSTCIIGGGADAATERPLSPQPT